jgi:hypothetical protein
LTILFKIVIRNYRFFPLVILNPTENEELLMVLIPSGPTVSPDGIGTNNPNPLLKLSRLILLNLLPNFYRLRLRIRRNILPEILNPTVNKEVSMVLIPAGPTVGPAGIGTITHPPKTKPSSPIF